MSKDSLNARHPNVVDRPSMPGYGLAPAGEGKLLEWSWAVRPAYPLARAMRFWRRAK